LLRFGRGMEKSCCALAQATELYRALPHCSERRVMQEFCWKIRLVISIALVANGDSGVLALLSSAKLNIVLVLHAVPTSWLRSISIFVLHWHAPFPEGHVFAADGLSG